MTAGHTQRMRPSIASTARKVAKVSCQGVANTNESTATRRDLLAGVAASLGAAVMLPAASQAKPFLQSTGASGILADEEEKLYRLRQEKEGEARKLLLEEREKLEEESRQTMMGKLCATPFGIDVVGITEFVALVGALVGGIAARQRKEELERLNEQLRKINMSLRQQARAGTIYAPGLTYAPPSDGTSPTTVAMSRTAPLAPPKPTAPSTAGSPAPVATATVVAPRPIPASKATSTILSMEEDEMGADQLACRDALRAGKRLLKEKNGAAAMVRFEKALMLSKALADKVQERRANRGLAAAARLQGQYRTAIKHLERVLEISREMREYTGDADAYGTVADCYTDMGEFEKAAQFYDKYIECMNRDGPV